MLHIKNFASLNCDISCVCLFHFRRPSTGGSTQFVHTLNGTALATPRILLTLLETNQQEDGTVHIPQVLVSYMGGRTKILPKTRKHLPEQSPSSLEENEQGPRSPHSE
jgi:hypothetical protein